MWYFDWPKIVFSLIACNFKKYAAHRRTLLQQEAADAACARPAVHESFDNVRSRKKAQCQAERDDSEIEHIPQLRKKRCGEKINHKKGIQAEQPPATTKATNTHTTASNRG